MNWSHLALWKTGWNSSVSSYSKWIEFRDWLWVVQPWWWWRKGRIYPAVVQNRKRNKELNQFCPQSSSDDLWPSLLYLSFFNGHIILLVHTGSMQMGSNNSKINEPLTMTYFNHFDISPDLISCLLFQYSVKSSQQSVPISNSETLQYSLALRSYPKS